MGVIIVCGADFSRGELEKVAREHLARSLVFWLNHQTDYFFAGIASATKTPVLSVKVTVRKGETLSSALHRLQSNMRIANRRQWSKTRPGAYEKPSYRRRKRESLRKRNARLARWHRQVSRKICCTVYLTVRQLFLRKEIYQRQRPPLKPHRRVPKDEST